MTDPMDELRQASADLQSASLSPAAQAVLDAMHRSYDHEPTRRAIAADVLRALANQASPSLHIEDIQYQHQSYVDGWKDALDVILAIAAKLEGGR